MSLKPPSPRERKGGERLCICRRSLLVCGVRNWSLMVFVLFVNEVASHQAVKS